MLRTASLKQRIQALEEELAHERTARTAAENTATSLRCELRHTDHNLDAARKEIEWLNSQERDFSLQHERQARAAAAALEEAFIADSPQAAAAAAQRSQALMALDPRCFTDPQVFCDPDTDKPNGFAYGVLTADCSIQPLHFRCDAKAFLTRRHGLTSADADKLLREHEEAARRRHPYDASF
ncbi:hypothetical protein O4J56_06860 [Nocardiopsis sp. RSe5-2]|uniref:Uncharacterized protein n=1 Tax=Nocardiopsis endophytica TaxID=3018445 RepID=A0ABT4U085_9ACTN|nr:hypothetical protein [Nocardiopsis endophytica]MDA2810355.1 hypothetical protein [Nocardiopsis endophytica]